MTEVAEKWRAIEGWPGYHVSDRGRVRSFKRGDLFDSIILLENRQPPSNRALVTLYRGRKPTTLLVSRLVCAAFHGPAPSPDHQAAHGNGDIYNDAASNLSWKTPLENMADRDRHGRTIRGMAHHSNILWVDEAVAIRMEYDEWKAKGGPRGFVGGLARRYGVTIGCIEDIIYRRSWTQWALASEIMRGSFGACQIGEIA